MVRVEPGANAAADSKPLGFRFDELGARITDEVETGNSYLARMELVPGQYVLRVVTAQAMGFPVIGTFSLPLHLDMSLDQPGAYYLGHLDMTIRERKDNEFRAGPVIPLMDQAVVGASGGTLDVVVSDRLAVDESRFRQTFSPLREVPFRSAILPPFDRAKAQKYWEGN